MESPLWKGATGFVLAGGASSRMGSDKALLRAGGETLLEQVAHTVREAAGSVVLIAPPERYADFGFPVVADLIAGAGPLGGLYTALSVTSTDWNLIVACDMPAISAPVLGSLLDAAQDCGRLAVVPETPRGLEPLCAVYHRKLLPEVVRAIADKAFKMHDFVRSIDALRYAAADSSAFQNVNTPADWAQAHGVRSEEVRS